MKKSFKDTFSNILLNTHITQEEEEEEDPFKLLNITHGIMIEAASKLRDTDKTPPPPSSKYIIVSLVLPELGGLGMEIPRRS